MSPAPAFLGVLALAATSCVTEWKREEARVRHIREHYEAQGVDADRAQLDALLSKLEWVVDRGCPQLREPCRVLPEPGQAPEVRCFQWGSEASCLRVTGTRALQLERLDPRAGRSIELWLLEHLDPHFAQVSDDARRAAQREVFDTEPAPFSANSVWIAARVTFQAPTVSIGFQAQGGWRKWLTENTLVSLGAGYERSVLTSTGLLMPIDSVLFTARYEVGSHSEASARRFDLPDLSGYFGVTGVLGVDPVLAWTTRGFVGFSAIVPVTLELGYAVSALPGRVVSNFYVSAGLGF